MTEGEASEVRTTPSHHAELSLGSKGDLALEARRRRRGENGLGLVRLISRNGSNEPDIGNRRRSSINMMHLETGIVWTHTGAREYFW
jgi:hypothetical protein